MSDKELVDSSPLADPRVVAGLAVGFVSRIIEDSLKYLTLILSFSG